MNSPWIATIPGCSEPPTITPYPGVCSGPVAAELLVMLGEEVAGTHLDPPPAPHGGYFPQDKAVAGWHIPYKQSRKSHSSG